MKTEWIKGKALSTISKRFHNALWYTFWDDENKILDVSYTGAGVTVNAIEIHFSEKLRANKVVYKVKNGQVINMEV